MFFGSFVFQKRSVPFDSQERLAIKRQKLTEQRSQRQSVDKGLVNNKEAQSNVSLTHNPSVNSNSAPQRTRNHTDNQCGLTGSHGGFPLMHKLHSPSDELVSESREPDSKTNGLQPPPCDSDCVQQPLAINQHRKKKSKKHKDKERERLKDDKDTEWIKSSPDLKQNPDKDDSKALFCTFLYTFTVISHLLRVLCYGPPCNK